MFNKDTHSLVLRACSEDMSSKNNFKWPTSGEGGKCKAGYNGMISIYYENNRTRLKVGYIGEDGLEPDTFYKLDENNNFTTCE